MKVSRVLLVLTLLVLGTLLYLFVPKDETALQSDVLQPVSVTNYTKVCENIKEQKRLSMEKRLADAKTSFVQRLIRKDLEALEKVDCECYATNAAILDKVGDLEMRIDQTRDAEERESLRSQIVILLELNAVRPCPTPGFGFDVDADYAPLFYDQETNMKELVERHSKPCHLYISELTTLYNSYLNAKKGTTRNLIRRTIQRVFEDLQESSCPDCSQARTIIDLNLQFLQQVQELDDERRSQGLRQDVANLVISAMTEFENRRLQVYVDRCVKDRATSPQSEPDTSSQTSVLESESSNAEDPFASIDESEEASFSGSDQRGTLGTVESESFFLENSPSTLESSEFFFESDAVESPELKRE